MPIFGQYDNGRSTAISDMSAAGNFILNGTVYTLDLKLFSELSVVAKGLLVNQTPPIKVDVKDLDDKSFGIFAQAINDPNFSVDMQNVLQFLKACLVWCVPTFVESTVQFLVQQQCPPRDTIIAAVRLGHEYRTHHIRAMDVLEHHIASQPESYLQAEEFAKLPIEVILRIFTWYNEPVPNTPEFFNFVMKMFHVVGVPATLLLELVDLSKVPASWLAQHRDAIDFIDLDIIGDKVLRELRPPQREKADPQRVASLRNAILDAQREKAKLVQQYEAMTRGCASAKKKCQAAAAELKRLQALKDTLSAKMEKLNQERKKLETQVAELVEKRKAAQEKQKEIEKEQQEEQANEGKAKKQAAPEAPQTSAPTPEPEPPAPQPEPVPEPEPEPVPEPEPAKQELAVEPPPTKTYLKVPQELFKLEEFLPRMANLKAEDLTIFLPEELMENLTRSDEARAVYLDYLWRNVEMKSRDASADYGALLAAQETECDDLAISLLKYAVEKGSPDAMFNLAVMMKNERGGLKATNDEIAKLIVDAANGGLEAAQHVMEKAQ